MPIFQICAIVQTIIYNIPCCTKFYVLNQGYGYWLLSNALSFYFILCIAMKANVVKVQILI